VVAAWPQEAARGGESLVGNRHVAEYARTQQRLRGILYRFDCPSPLTIGEYVLDLLEMRPRMELARHVLECGACDEELTTVRAFLATEPSMPTAGAWYQVKRVVASLLTPTARPAFGMVRGSERSVGAEYRAGPIKIVIGAVPGRRRGTVSVDGLILHDSAPSDALVNREVMLLDTAQLKVHLTRTDDLGSFAFEDVAAGNYSIEVTLAEEVVVVEDVRVTS
jgi:hypothetical protein